MAQNIARFNARAVAAHPEMSVPDAIVAYRRSQSAADAAQLAQDNEQTKQRNDALRAASIRSSAKAALDAGDRYYEFVLPLSDGATWIDLIEEVGWLLFESNTFAVPRSSATENYGHVAMPGGAPGPYSSSTSLNSDVMSRYLFRRA